MDNMDKISKLAENLMLDTYSHVDRGIGDHYYHGQRVAKLAVTLRKLVLPEDASHDDILTVAGWFHDIAKSKPQHARFGAAMAGEALREYCTAEELSEITNIIRLHDDRGHPEYADFIKLQQDADLLDHFGTYNVWMTYAYRSFRHESNLLEIADFDLADYEKHMYHIDQCNYEVSRRICKEKRDYWRDFMKRVKVEANGEFWAIPE
jgi:uncharacterized protein